MEKLTYSEISKAEKPRHRFPPRNGIEPTYSEIISSNRMNNNSRKPNHLCPSKDLKPPDRSNAGFGDSEHVTRSQKEEKKMAFKLYCKKKKEEAKKEKQREKEEKKLEKIVGPKGESISVIDRDMFHRISSTASRSASVQESDAISMDAFSFPDLRQGMKRTPRKPATKVETVTAGEVVERVVQKVEDQVEVPPKSQTKSRKKKDPVVVDILKAIEVCKAERQPSKKSDVNVVGKKSTTGVSKIAGNILDSSNPLRHRGKKREVPKKRSITRLKKAVMLERAKRRALREISQNKNCASTSPDEAKAGDDVNLIKCEPDFTQEYPTERVESISEIKPEQPLENSNNYTLGDVIQEDSSKKIADIDVMVKEKLHSKKFRDYCNHLRRQDLSEAVTSMMQDIVRFQDRAHFNTPIKAEMHRRYVLGLKQVNNLLSVQKVKIIIMASDIEKVPAPGGLDDIVTTIIDHADKQKVPVIFNFPRRQLGKLTYRKVPVSCIAILNYHGTEAAFQKMTEALEVAKKEYHERFMTEKTRVMNELGIPIVKMENADPEVKTVMPEPDITYPLLKRLSEAISELSLQSPRNSDEINEALSFKSSIL